MSCTSQVIKDIGLPCWGIWAADKKLPGLREGSDMVFASHVERMAGAAASEEALQLVQSNMRACIVNCENLNEDVRDSSVLQLTWNSSFMWLPQCPLNIWSPCTPRVTILKLRELLRVSTEKWMSHVICWLMYPLIVWKGKNFLDWLPPGWLLTRWH